MAVRSSLSIIHCLRAPVGGAFRHVLDLAQAQQAAGHRVGIVCDSLTGGDFEAGRIAEVAPLLTFGISRIPMGRSIAPSDVAVSFRLLKRIAALKPDVLHGHGSKGGAYARMIGTALRLAGQSPLRLYCPHGGSLHYDAATRKGRLFFAIERLLERMTDGLVFVSDYEARTYAAKIGTPRVPWQLARNGLTAPEFEPLAPDGDASDFLFVGSLRHLKGIDVMVAALKRLSGQGRTVTALIVGDGVDERTIHAEVAASGLADRIVFAGPMPIRNALPRGRVMVVPSRAESLPYVVLEALAANVPVIATDVGGIGEIFGDLAGRLVPPDDAAALAVAMQRALDDPGEIRAATATLRARMREHFSIEAMTRSIDGFYDRLSGRDVGAVPVPAQPAAPRPALTEARPR